MGSWKVVEESGDERKRRSHYRGTHDYDCVVVEVMGSVARGGRCCWEYASRAVK